MVLHPVDLNFNALTFQLIRNFDFQYWANFCSPRMHAFGLGNQIKETHFVKDRNCEVCMRTQMTRAPCRKRTGEALLRAEKFGALVSADHKVFQ